MSSGWGWRYVAGATLGWVLFVASFCAVFVGREKGWPEAALVGLAAVPAVTVALTFRAAYLRIASLDEFLRAITAKRVILAAGVSITLATAWSMGELVGLPHLPAWAVYPLFWSAFGTVGLAIRRSQP